MAINQVSNNQPDITSRYNDAQHAQRKSPEDQGLQQGRQLQDNGAAAEDVKVSLSSQKKTETKGRVNAERTEPQRQEQ
ncbi:MAG: hypothetical protein HY099_03840, partial [Nitrospirae bacterium]|nr:hypothetical protein [Nitrospirota bacterium]